MHVLHEDRQSFERTGALISGCPCCKGLRPEDLTEKACQDLDALKELALMLGDDIDGFAALLEDFAFIGLI
ncbi:MAG: hypothetical protein DWQ34_13220 [Planctomycetota bacterium]|nr:MAG: hypothetical protein DWQ34_13220 [Planctomycetota bacterium]REK28052.1 MAG: hypothetical protein DWQ41_06470 [Planctomycetota bacterium]REK37579.1 MAG: hypothetical protein DWQ45_06155 [Planctomycetota bacterium]